MAVSPSLVRAVLPRAHPRASQVKAIATIASSRPSSGLPASTVTKTIASKIATTGSRVPDIVTSARSVKAIGRSGPRSDRLASGNLTRSGSPDARVPALTLC